MVSTNCPGCGASTVLLGHALSYDGRGGITFAPWGINPSLWSVSGIEVSTSFACCSSCGLLWSRVQPNRLRDLIAQRGSELLRQYFAALDGGRYHGLPDIAEAREAADGVVEIDMLILFNQRPEATRRYRERKRCTWDQAIDTLRHWQDLGRAEKLALLGWRPKEAVAARKPNVADHPMQDRELDFG